MIDNFQVALITNHASSYMVMCEAFRTPEHNENKILNTGGFAENALISQGLFFITFYFYCLF